MVIRKRRCFLAQIVLEKLGAILMLVIWLNHLSTVMRIKTFNCTFAITLHGSLNNKIYFYDYCDELYQRFLLIKFIRRLPLLLVSGAWGNYPHGGRGRTIYTQSTSHVLF